MAPQGPAKLTLRSEVFSWCPLKHSWGFLAKFSGCFYGTYKKEYSTVDVVLSLSHSASSSQPREINLWLKWNHEKENGKKKRKRSAVGAGECWLVLICHKTRRISLRVNSVYFSLNFFFNQMELLNSKKLIYFFSLNTMILFLSLQHLKTKHWIHQRKWCNKNIRNSSQLWNKYC